MEEKLRIRRDSRHSHALVGFQHAAAGGDVDAAALAERAGKSGLSVGTIISMKATVLTLIATASSTGPTQTTGLWSKHAKIPSKYSRSKASNHNREFCWRSFSTSIRDPRRTPTSGVSPALTRMMTASLKSLLVRGNSAGVFSVGTPLPSVIPQVRSPRVRTSASCFPAKP